MLQEVEKQQRKVIIEDVREININMPNTIRMESMTLSSREDDSRPCQKQSSNAS